MNIPLSEFTYTLPANRIAQHPARPRESAKLMIVSRVTDAIVHKTVSDLPDFFNTGDVLVINNTKVFHARLHGTLPCGNTVELFLIRPLNNFRWLALGKPGRKLIVGNTVQVADTFIAEIVEKNADGTLIISFHLSPEDTIRNANIFGTIPIPPYIKTLPKEDEYQTVYAKYIGSVAAPTAGFHLTKNILKQLKNKGVVIQEITLHVGLGTFMPIKSDTLEAHTMHSEWVQITAETASYIRQAKKDHRKIIAIGTTTVRTLEGVAALHNGSITDYSGDVSIFITPGFTFRVIDGMLTNFHLPKSSLIVLVSSFAGIPIIQKAYATAMKHNYRFYSFGDAMLIL